MANRATHYFFVVMLLLAAVSLASQTIDDAWNFVLLDFGLEGLRAGILLVNIRVRMASPGDYKRILGAVILLTIGIGFGIDQQYLAASERFSDNWWTAQITNVMILLGEYSLGLLLSFNAIDYTRKFKETLEQLYRALNKLEDAKPRLEKAKQFDKLRKEYDIVTAKYEKLFLEHDTLKNIKRLNLALPEKLSINGNKARVCQSCSTITVARSNVAKPPCSNCGKELSW